MPTYEYECTACAHVFEAFQAMSDAPLSTCPSCGKKIKRRINGGLGVIFKGSGFYINDSVEKKPCDSCPPKKQESCPATAGSSSET